ncbi:TPA: type IV conjugative transfer system pilin TraA [Klebsiella aerogenes]|nr:type IV conjugative transfer system pilin TraA [Klebsiella aerogenes]
MTTALSIQNAEMSKGVKPSLRTCLFSKTRMLKAAKAVFPVAVLAAAFPEVAMATTTGTDLMKTGDGTVKATFGKGSSVIKWVILAEVIVGAIMYMMTKNVKFLAGFAILSVFVTVGMSVAGY